MQNNYKRRNYFIDKKFQTKFILVFCLIVIASSVLTMGILLSSSRGSNTVMIEDTHVIVKTTADFIFPLTIQTIFIVSILSGISVALLTLFVSHKISGPLFRLTTEVEAMKSGDLTRSFKIRGADQLQVFSESLFKMSDSFKCEIIELKKEVSELKSLLKDKNFKLSEEEKTVVKGVLESLSNRINKFKTA